MWGKKNQQGLLPEDKLKQVIGVAGDFASVTCNSSTLRILETFPAYIASSSLLPESLLVGSEFYGMIYGASVQVDNDIVDNIVIVQSVDFEATVTIG